MEETLKQLAGLTNANQSDKEKIVKTYRAIFGDDIYICLKCPATIRQAHKRLKEYYAQNY